MKSRFLLTLSLVGLLALTGAACKPRSSSSDDADTSSYGSSKGFKTIYFDYDRDAIRSSQVDNVENNVNAMKKNPGTKITLEGHADDRGTNEYNMALGDRRARTVFNYMVNVGIERSRLKVVSFGEEQPVCNEASENCWAKNRRVESVKR